MSDSRRAVLVGGLSALVIACLMFWFGGTRLRPPEQVLKVPGGFEIELVAGPPLVDRPIVADFDEQARLYVADSSGSNAPLAQQVKHPSHRIVRLEDSDGGGRVDKATVFADTMTFPEGAN